MVLNDPVIAKVRAYNAKGWGSYTIATTYATVKTVPVAPPVAITNGAATDENQIQISWTALTGDNTG